MSASPSLLVLFETAYGYALFERLEGDEIGRDVETVSAAMQDLSKFGKAVKLVSFLPFKGAAEALQNMNEISEGMMGECLRTFLETNLPKNKKNKEPSKKSSGSGPNFVLGVSDKTLASSIKSELGVECISDDSVFEVVRGLRQHGHTMLKAFREGDMEKAQLGLGHSYSRAKVKFNVHRSDNMILQASALLDQMDKDINTFAMRMREWYGWHFPELGRLISDHRLFARLALAIPEKNALTEESLSSLEEALEGDATTAKLILDAARSSMGTDISPLDMINIKNFAKRVLDLTEYRIKLHGYLQDKMEIVAPNLSALIGEIVGARLIAQAGSLTNLSKFPASTVQILGAEKALFRALKTKGKTPKYGLIYHSSFIGKAGLKNKGRISRYLANKCAIASRLDCFADTPTNKFGEALRSQVEERLDFYENGVKPKKNIDVMHNVIASLEKEAVGKEKKSKKEKRSDKEEEEGFDKKEKTAEKKEKASGKKEKDSGKKEKDSDKKEKGSDRKEKDSDMKDASDKKANVKMEKKSKKEISEQESGKKESHKKEKSLPIKEASEKSPKKIKAK